MYGTVLTTGKWLELWRPQGRRRRTEKEEEEEREAATAAEEVTKQSDVLADIGVRLYQGLSYGGCKLSR